MIDPSEFVADLPPKHLFILYDYLIENEHKPDRGSTELLGAVADRRQLLMDITEGFL